MEVFDTFLSKFPPESGLQKPSGGIMEQFKGKLPTALLDLWREYGFGNYGQGLLKIINPADYADTTSLWIGKIENCYPILMSGFGVLFVYRKLSDTTDDICLLDIHHRKSGSFSIGFSDFFSDIVPSDSFAKQFLLVDLFQEASVKFGAPAANEIFFFASALVLGGRESMEYVRKGDVIVHQHLLYEMGSADDAWSEAYEANPHAFGLDEGGVLISFTLTETVDTILPISPEKEYEIEGETISKWLLIFFSLTEDENLCVLEYHRALQLLQPYVMETRDSHILIRGLSLAEMKSILSKEI